MLFRSFIDDTSIISNQRIIDICKEIIKRKIKLKFRCQGRIKPVSKEMFYWMEKANFYEILFGSVLALMCCLITLWAIAGEMIGYRFETPVLSFTFTVPVFVAVVVAGGAALVLLQYWLTIIAAKLSSFGRRSDGR